MQITRRLRVLLLMSGIVPLLQAAHQPELPGRYFRLLDAGMTKVAQLWAAEPDLDWPKIEARGDGWRHFPHTVLAAAVLYGKQDPDNPRYHDPKMLALALRIGDFLAAEDAQGIFQKRLNSHRDAYMWLEAYRLLGPELGNERRERWRRAIERNLAQIAADAAERADFPGYQSPFIGTSPNHFSLWASTLYLAGRTFENPQWEKLGARILHRFAVVEQSRDGYWGEHDRSLPTPGYDYTTYSGIALYYEHSRDPAALEALRRGLDFHKFFTYPDGSPVEVLDDRNRYTEVSGWGRAGFETWSDQNPPPAGNDESASKGHFGFSNFPDGRRYAEFLTGFFREGQVGYEDLGRLAQNALYYHRGPVAAIPQDLARYDRRLTVPAGIRKTDDWVVCLSGLISTQAINNQYYLDRQSHFSVFHHRLGLIVTGAGSKGQPQLATFTENVAGQLVHMPITSRLDTSAAADRLSLAYNTFFSELSVPTPSPKSLAFRFSITGRAGPAAGSALTLQLCLRAGEALETGAGKTILLGRDRIELSPADLGGWIRHHGWTLRVDPAARLVWPVYPYDPYGDKPEAGLAHAVGALSVPLRPPSAGDRFIRPNAQAISFVLETEPQ